MWMKIIAAAAMVLMVVVLFPRAQEMLKNSPKAEAGDWRSAIIPILFVVGFVILLIMMV